METKTNRPEGKDEEAKSEKETSHPSQVKTGDLTPEKDPKGGRNLLRDDELPKERH